MTERFDTPEWDPAALAYAAGFLDGEGCFYVHSREGGRYHKGVVSCSNTYRPIIEWLQKTFGGSISATGRRRKVHHRPVYTWQLVSNQARIFCGAISPYLKEKAEQALLVLMVQQTMGLTLTDEVRKERERFATISKELKHVES